MPGVCWNHWGGSQEPTKPHTVLMTNISPSLPCTPKRDRCWWTLDLCRVLIFFFFPMNWYIFTCTLSDENSLILPALFSHCARGQPMLAPSRDFCSGPEVLFVAQPQLFRHPTSTSSHQVARQWQFTPNTNNISASHQIIVDNQPVYANTANSANAPYG